MKSTLIPLGKSKSSVSPPIPSNLLSPQLKPISTQKAGESSMIKLPALLPPSLPSPSYPSLDKMPSLDSKKISSLNVSPPQNLQINHTTVENVPETLMVAANKVPEIEIKTPESALSNSSLSINTSNKKFSKSPSTAVFETYEGVVEKSVEQALLDSGFLPTEKILTRDNSGNVMCQFIKARNKLGHAVYVELDCDTTTGLGYVSVSPSDPVLTVSSNASVIPYSLKIGAFEANSDLYGIGFECDNSICIMSRKDPSLEPIETVFSYAKDSGNDMGIIENHNVPFPIVKMSEILADPNNVARNIAISHGRMRNVAFHSCMKEVESMKRLVKELEKEIENFDKVSSEVAKVLSSTINELENMHAQYEKRGIASERDAENVKSIRFNLNKRQDLTLDHIALCHSMKERAAKIKALRDELASLNEFSQTLFTGLSSVFTE